MSNKKYLGDGRSDGTVMGNSATDLIAFYDVTPVVQPALSATAAVSTAVAVLATSSAAVYGFSSAQANGIIGLINALRAQQVTLGLAAT